MRLPKFLFIPFIFLFFSCNSAISDSGTSNPNAPVSISLATWNLQTFFDAVTEGTEYTEFKKASNWYETKYQARLARLCEVMNSLNADVFVFEEMENERIIQDIFNQFAGNSWNSKKNWTYACFSKHGSASIGCAVLSKYPLSNMKIHTMDIQSQKSKQPSMRPILQVTVNVGNKQLVIFANHWKSKSGGEVETEIWRDWQESVLAEKFLSLGIGTAAVACGDFNRDAADFFCDFNSPAASHKYNTLLRAGSLSKEPYAEVFSPWFLSSGKWAEKYGSYFFEDQWERIDNIFAFGDVKLSNFRSKAEQPWCLEDGTPFSYKIYTGNGYSDHVPLMCTLTF